MKAVQMAPLTVEDYRQLPETGPRYQLIEGDLFMAPAPNRFHQDIVCNLHYQLRAYLEKRRIGALYIAPFDVYIDDINALQPDIVFIASENDILTAAGAEGSPDFVVEVLSPKTAHLDRISKRRVYARSGVKEFWIIDPHAKQVHVYLLQRDPEEPHATYGVRDTFTSPTFPGLKFKATAIFKAQ
jgi:Uma2 family endonuclease